MSRIKLKKVDQISRKTVSDARDGFLRHCQLKNLAPHTYTYYKENLQFFFDSAPQVKFVDEFNQETIENFIGQLMDKGNRVTAINARLRAAFVFLRYCFEQEYLEAFPLSLIKEDETYKEPYTDSELQKLLKQPQDGTWVEWRNWAVINLLLATGVRANTVVNIKISDVDFEHNIIRLRKLKNRKQQMVPMSTTLNTALSLYLKVWDWGEDDYFFPCNDHQQLQAHSLILSIRKYNLARGVTKTSVHLFRHTFAKNYILAGGGMIQLQAILGHSTLDMTRKYINLYGNDIQRDFDRLNPLNNILEKTQ